jgi:hypothetical protein
MEMSEALPGRGDFHSGRRAWFDCICNSHHATSELTVPVQIQPSRSAVELPIGLPTTKVPDVPTDKKTFAPPTAVQFDDVGGQTVFAPGGLDAPQFDW